MADRTNGLPAGAALVVLGDWYCPECEDYICDERVTFEETCDTCGAAVEWYAADDGDAPESRAAVEDDNG